MGTVAQFQLSDALKATVNRHIAQGLAASEADYLAEAVRRYAEDLDAGDFDLEDDIEAIALAGIADAEAGRYTVIESEADAEAMYHRVMARVRASLANDTP